MRILFFLLLSCFVTTAHAQGTYVPLGSDAYHFIDRLDIKYSRIIPIQFTVDKGYHRADVAKVAETMLLSNLRFNKVQQYQLQWLVDESPEYLDSLQSRTQKPLWKALYREPASFAHYSSKKKGLFDIRLNPVFDLKTGWESFDNRFTFTTTRGIEVRGNIKKVFSFYFNGLGNAARFNHYITNTVRKENDYDKYVFVPGMAYWKDYKSSIFKFNDGVDYFDARGYININALKYINISFGRDKFFLGNGMRSFYLSDFSAPYLFLKFDISYWRFRYQTIIAELNSQYIRGADQLLPKKYMAVHHLTFQPTHFLSFGLFEGVVMQRSKQFELQYLNPIIFYRAVEHAVGSPDNVLLGVDFKLNLINHLSIYGQFVLDEFNFKNATKRNGWYANKWALQTGIKYIDIIPNLDGQLEVNVARPFMFTHESTINYSHYNQPLAHPLGANFIEVMMQLRYQPIAPLTITGRFFAARTGGDTLVNGELTNLGQDILRPSGGNTVTQEFGNKFGQGAQAAIRYFQLLMSYQPWHNIYIDAEVLYRAKSGKQLQDATSQTLQQFQSTFGFNVCLRMNLAFKRFEF